MEFGVSQIVYHPKYGKGRITDVTSSQIVVLFDDETHRAFNIVAAERELSPEPIPEKKEEEEEEKEDEDGGQRRRRTPPSRKGRIAKSRS